MKILFLVDDVKEIESFLAAAMPELKIITENEIKQDTPYSAGFVKPGYSRYITERTANISRAYRFKRPLAILLDKKHQEANIKLSVDDTVRIIGQAPKRMSDGVGYKTNHVIKQDDLEVDFIKNLYLDNDKVS